MKNLKKVLALVLAFACAFTMFAGAAFTDEADIQAKDAVNMLTSLGVIEGLPDGSFNPDRVVTRAEMAKMIFVVRNNTIDDEAYQNIATDLTDIDGHWAKGYIKFCESQGIIAGKGKGIFAPDAPVTGVEAAKMLLVLAGYTPDKAGLTGSAWQTNTLRYAGAAGILDAVSSSLSAGLPRQWAAQMIANTLDADRVLWSNDSETFDQMLNGGKKETVGQAYMDLCYDYGTLTVVDTDTLTVVINNAYSAENYHAGTVQFTKVGADYSDLLGQTVKVMFKDGKTNDVIGVYAISDNTVYNTLMNGVELDGNKIKFGGSSYAVDSTRAINLTFVDAEDGASTKTVDINYFNKDGADNKDHSNGNTSLSEVTFVDSDGNNKIDTAIVIEKLGGQVTNVASDKITFAGKSYKFAEDIIDEDLAADDYAVMSYNMYKDCKEIVKADVLTDELSGSKDKTSDNGNYKQYEIADNWYNIDSTDSDTGYDNVSVGDTVLAYVANGVILNVDTDDGTGAIPSNIAVVVGNGSGSTTLYGDQVKLRFFDGTLKTVTVDNSKSEVAGSATQLGRAYKVSGSDSATKLNELENKKYNGYETLIYGAYNVSQLKDIDLSKHEIAGKRVADDAVIVVWDETGSSKLITGKQFNNLASTGTKLKTTDGAGAVFTKDYNGLDRVRMASVAVATGSTIGAITGTSNDNYGYITSDAIERTNGDVTYTLWNGSENLTVKEENGTASERAKGTVIGYGSIDADGYIQEVDDSYGLLKEVTNTAASDSNLAVGANKASTTNSVSVGNNQLNVTADTKVLVIDSSESGDAIGQEYTYGTTTLRKADKDVDGNYMNNVAYILDEALSDGEADLELLIVDNTGKFDWVEDGSEEPVVVEEGETVETQGNFTVVTPDSGVVEVAARRDGSDNKAKAQLTFELPEYATAATYDWTMKVGNYVIGSGTDVASTITSIASTETVGAEDLVTVRIYNVKVTEYKVNTITDNSPDGKFTSVVYKTSENLANGTLKAAGEAANVTVTPATGAGTSKTITLKVKLTNATVNDKAEFDVTGTTDSTTETTAVDIALGTVIPTGDGAVGVEILATSTIA